MSYFDEELEKEFSTYHTPYKKLEQGTHDDFVIYINNKLPFAGAKIDWNSLPNSKNFNEHEKSQAFKLITEKIRSLATPEIFFIGDSLTECAYQVEIKDLERALLIFSEIPQHSYFFPKDLSWIGCISAEGHIDLSTI
ncbi:hypothetical protein [Pseudomonas sp. C9]|jgi:hypothetical protein|uniref:hypothetical protein n=1 Tax=Pseudomonas sp. C9 TaxID=1311337 RepID=UPI000984BEF7|nr:hypothetical protein [Pseudomonas sp. C9]OOG11033.1 hypothetical protein BMS17_02640 [Pseudomonas sp. C9]